MRVGVRGVEAGPRREGPRLYLPGRALPVPLVKLDKVTHCPLKGDAHYFSLEGQEIAWAYRSLDFAAVLDGLYSFWGDNMRIVEGE